MMDFMNVLVHKWMVEHSMNPINHHVIKEHEEHNTDNQISSTKCANVIVQEAVSTDLGQENWHREERHEGTRSTGHLNL